MRKLATLATACLLALILALPAGADARGSRSKSGGEGGSVAVRSYVRKDGTVVRGHRRTASDRNKYHNWSTKRNTPYTGKVGTENP
jgi:hypothetical protein